MNIEHMGLAANTLYAPEAVPTAHRARRNGGEAVRLASRSEVYSADGALIPNAEHWEDDEYRPLRTHTVNYGSNTVVTVETGSESDAGSEPVVDQWRRYWSSNEGRL